MQKPADGNFQQLQSINFVVTIYNYIATKVLSTMYTVLYQYSPAISLISKSSLCRRGISWFKYCFWASWRWAWYWCPSRWSYWYGVNNGSYHLTKGTENLRRNLLIEVKATVVLWRKLHLSNRSHFKTYTEVACIRSKLLFTVLKYLSLFKRYWSF